MKISYRSVLSKWLVNVKSLSIFGIVFTFLISAAFANTTAIQQAIENSLNDFVSPDLEYSDELTRQAVEHSRSLGSPFSWAKSTLLWCEIVLIDANAVSVSECARARVGAVSQMSNPQPSREAVLEKRIQEALDYLDQALELVSQKEKSSRAIVYRIKFDILCLEGVASKRRALDCYLDHRF